MRGRDGRERSILWLLDRHSRRPGAGLGKLSTGNIGGIIGGSTALVGNIVGNIAGGVAGRQAHRQAIAHRRDTGRAAHAQAARQAMGSIRTEFPWNTVALAGGGLVVLGGIMVFLLQKKKQQET